MTRSYTCTQYILLMAKKLNYCVCVLVCVVEGKWTEEDGRSCLFFIQGVCLAGDPYYNPTVNLGLDVAFQHHRTIIGSGGGNVRKIMQQTETM